jgi:protein-histidine pros-kinase
MAVPLKMADDGFRDLLISLGIIFLATMAMTDIAMYFLVIAPLNRVLRAADRVSKGELDLPPLVVKGNDEISAVTASFNRMHTSLIKAFEMLNR